MARGGTLVESMTLDRKVMGVYPILAAALGTLASPSQAALRRVNSATVSIAVVGIASV